MSATTKIVRKIANYIEMKICHVASVRLATWRGSMWEVSEMIQMCTKESHQFVMADTLHSVEDGYSRFMEQDCPYCRIESLERELAECRTDLRMALINEQDLVNAEVEIHDLKRELAEAHTAITEAKRQLDLFSPVVQTYAQSLCGRYLDAKI